MNETGTWPYRDERGETERLSADVLVLGGGVAGCMLDETLVERMLACCEENGIAYQRDVMDRGGTDAGPINRSGVGVRVAAVALVDRYAHSQSSIISLRDARAAVELLDRYTALTFAFEE